VRREPAYRWLPVVMMAWCVAVQWVAPVHQAVGYLEIFWSRVPIFLIGINMGEGVRRRDELGGHALWLVLLVFALTLATCIYMEQQLHGRFPLFIERMAYIPLTVSSLLLLATVLARAPRRVDTVLSWVGGISLEVYLLHVGFVLGPLGRLHLGYWPSLLLCLAVTLPAAWLLQRIMNVLTKKIK